MVAWPLAPSNISRPKARRWTRHATAAGVALALLFTGILATSAYLFGRHMGSGKEAMLYSVLGAGVELAKIVLPLAIAAAWAQNQKMRAGIATLIFLSCLGWSLLSSMGLYALARDEAA